MCETREILSKIDRNQAKQEVVLESKLADLKQHADKLVRGFENLDNSSANRAVWELVQNACDLTDKCEITIDLRNAGFSFTHNGIPFTLATFISLIKQVSSKYDVNEVGKFGTGFISTHAFGRKFKLDSFLEIDGRYIKITDFMIDRSAKESKDMVSALNLQENQINQLIDSGEELGDIDAITTFTYLPESLTEHEHIKLASNSLHSYIPFVLTLNDRLLFVKVLNEDGTIKTYRKIDKVLQNGYYKTIIASNDKTDEVFSIKDETDEIEVILPISKNFEAFRFDKSIAKLFLYYPLIGTELWGCNFVIHSKSFAPTEPRDGIHLNSKTEQLQESEENNRNLIEKASRMIFEFIRTNSGSVSNPINLAIINFNVLGDKPLLNEYLLKLKESWVNEFKTFPLVETETERIQPLQTFFLDKELLLSDEAFDSIYNLTIKFWKNIPQKQLIRDWTGIVGEWNSLDIKYIGIKEMISKIQEAGTLNHFDNAGDLLTFYNYLISNGHSEFFNTHKLLPNIKGEFRQLAYLNKSINLPVILIEIADVLMPDVPKKHVNPDYKFNLEFPVYSRKNYTTEINDSVSKYVGEKASSTNITGEYLIKLLDYCKIFSTVDSASVPSKLMKLICRFYQHTEDLIPIPEIEDDKLDNRPAQRRILRMFLNDINIKDNVWVVENIEFLKEVISLGSSYSDYEDMFLTLPIYPNQLNILCTQASLKIEDNIPEEIKDLYDKVVKPKEPIRAQLVSNIFSSYMKNQERTSIRSITEKIETEFFNTTEQLSINDHPFRKEILQIIEKFKSSPEYKDYFPVLFSKRSPILVDLADGEDTFSILSLKAERIKDLAKLGNNPDFDEIIKLGQEALLEQRQKNSDFQHKHAIGIHIEQVLRNGLTTFFQDNNNIKIINEQDGQDIIIQLNDQPVYYIEVKSRWDANNSIKMSKNQTLKANEQKDNYTLCSVDMTKYTGENKYDVLDINEIKNIIKFNIRIGHDVKDLIETLKQTNDPDTIHLDGDYRTLVPMKYIENGIEFDDFEKFLIDQLNNKNA